MAKDDNINVRAWGYKKLRALKYLKKIDMTMTKMVDKLLDEIFACKGDPFERKDK